MRKPQQKEPPLWQAVIAGSVGGLCCTVVGHPFETIKVRLQTGSNTRNLFRNLYAGILSPIAGVTPIWAVSYSSWTGDTNPNPNPKPQTLTPSLGQVAKCYWIVPTSPEIQC